MGVAVDASRAAWEGLRSIPELIANAPDYVSLVPAYFDAAWQIVRYFSTPKTIAIAACVGFIFLLLRIFIAGRIGQVTRTLCYAGLAYWIASNESFHALFNGQTSAIITALVLVTGFWLPVTLLGGLLRAWAGSGQGDHGMIAEPSRPNSGEAFNVQRVGKENKQVVVIMMTDIVGYSARMEKNETATYALLKEHNVIMRRAITTNRGREIKTIGDAFMVVFNEPIDGLRCAIAMQKGLYAFNKPRPVNDHLKVRIGLYQGEAVVTEKDVFGETVNIAARMESITDPGGISISAEIYQAIKGKVEAGFQSIGTPKMKNISKPPEVYRVHLNHE